MYKLLLTICLFYITQENYCQQEMVDNLPSAKYNGNDSQLSPTREVLASEFYYQEPSEVHELSNIQETVNPGEQEKNDLLQLTISGFVRDSSNNILNGARISFSNGIDTAITDINGYYEVSVPLGYTGVAKAFLLGYKLNPDSIEFNNLISNQTNQDFTGGQAFVTVAGAFWFQGNPNSIPVVITFSNGGGSDTASGWHYTIQLPYGYSGTATPSLETWLFSPNQKTYVNLTADLIHEDFECTRIAISGYVTAGGSGIGGVEITFSNGGGSATSSVFNFGQYTRPVISGYSGTAIPFLLGWIFEPAFRDYTDVVGYISGQNYLAKFSPILEITYPIQGAILNDSLLIVQGTASPLESINWIQLKLNESEWEGIEEAANWNHEINLRPGINNIMLRAIGAFNTPSDTITISVTYTPNRVPHLDWAAEPGFASDGVNPDSGYISHQFLFKVEYKDADGDPPLTGFPKLHIKKGGFEINGSPFNMNEVSLTKPITPNQKNITKNGNEILISDGFVEGVVYYAYVEFSLPGTAYTYFFEAFDSINAAAVGQPTGERSGPIVNELFTQIAGLPFESINFFEMAWGDYDIDGDLDLLAGGTEATIYQNNGNDEFVEFPGNPLAGSGQSLLWFDYNMDGYLDILCSGSSGTCIYKNVSGNSFSLIWTDSLIAMDADFADYDNDGDFDLILVGTFNNVASSRIYTNEGNDNFSHNSLVPIIPVGQYRALVSWWDYDNDKDYDLVINGKHSIIPMEGIGRIYRNESLNNFTEIIPNNFPNYYYGSLDLADYNNDGKIDMIHSGYKPTELYATRILENQGENDFLSNYVSGFQGGVSWGDYDGDGYLDYVHSGKRTGIFPFTMSKLMRRNDGSFFEEDTRVLLSQESHILTSWADYDNDSDLDLILAGQDFGGTTTKLYRNNIINLNQPPQAPTNLVTTVYIDSVVFNWNKSTDDKTPQDGLNYNLRVGTTPLGIDIVSPMSNVSNGKRLIVRRGNTEMNNSWILRNLPPGTYYWGVQAIDNCFAGSLFSEENTFIVLDTSYWSSEITISDNSITESSLTLIFGQHPNATDGLDSELGEFQLPPLPPIGIFDSRFNLPTIPTVSSWLDLRDTSNHEINWLMSFQPGSGGFPMTFTWDTTSLPHGKFYLQDLFGGTLVNVNMKTQNSYTLTSPGLNTLQIKYEPPICINISVDTAWSLISVPVESEDMSKGNLFPSIYSVAFAYDNGYVIRDPLIVGEGFWMYFREVEIIQICGTKVGDTVPVDSGWNIIGAYETDIPIQQITTTPPGIIATYLFGYDAGYYLANLLEPGSGYWVRVTEDGVINLNNDAMNKNIENGEWLSLFENDFGKITITDKIGKNFTLYISKDELDLSNYDLPPSPPAGVFDIRFSSGKFLESLTTGKTIQVNSAIYPITIKAEGISIAVKDVINGQLLNETLNDGGELILTNSNITSIAISGQQINVIPISYAIEQNYPNPFNPITRIKFTIPKESEVSLKVYNILGEEVIALVNETMKPGYYDVEFDAASLASGVYLYRIKAGEFIQTKKMILMK